MKKNKFAILVNGAINEYDTYDSLEEIREAIQIMFNDGDLDNDDLEDLQVIQIFNCYSLKQGDLTIEETELNL